MRLRRGFLFGTLLLTGAVFTTHSVGTQPPGGELDGALEKMMKDAVARVSPSVVQVETSGGTDVISPGFQGASLRRGVGPTTGLAVSPDGYIISSAFNFANRPSAIFVAIPGHRDRYVAKVIATDHTRMLTLLKIDAAGLPVPAAAPKKEMKVGQWAVALGRSWTSLDDAPTISVGIISALGRIWGKAIQTDAKVSPVNYGGPLIDIQGRVLGVLVPANPRGQDETAGVEWYDSGIGFAVPLEDITVVLPKLKQGQDLKRGLLGITLQSADIYGAKPVIASVAPESAAAKAGIKPGDVVTEINGLAIIRQAQILHALGDKYEGDVVSVKVRRDKEQINLPDLKLVGSISSFIHPFLGVLAVRDDPEPGEEVRYVFPKSPADAAGIKAGDRIMQIGASDGPLRPFSGRDQLTSLLNRLTPGTPLKVEVQRKDDKKKETVPLILDILSEMLPAELPEPATLKQALEPRKSVAPPPLPKEDDKKAEKKERKAPPKKDDKGDKEEKPELKREEKKKVETGFFKRANAAGDREYWVYVPPEYDPNVAYGLVIWLHPAGKGSERDLIAVAEAWEDSCLEHHLILVAPKAENPAGWLASEADAVEQAAREIIDQYTIDSQRVVAHGMGIGGQMAYYLGLNSRSLIRGVATTGAVLTNQPKDNVADQRLAFFIVAGGKDPLAPAIAESKAKLAERRFPMVYREIPDMGHQYLDLETLEELVRWIDALDRQ